ncbi:MAG: protease complex subunit PrcB family protein [Gemmatimonadota bacterium]|nr:protease complex subunit PrcB family protein [Gemmatimonadota bacterium]
MRRRRSASVVAVMFAVVMLAVAVSMAGCDGSATGPRVPPGADALSSSHVLEGDLLFHYRHYSGYRERQRLVIRTAAAWSEAWTRITGPSDPLRPPPAIDFDHEMVVLVSMGERATGGYSIAIEGVYDASGRIFAEVREKSPGAGCFVTEAVTRPVDAVRVPRRDSAVIFVERAETVDCR